MARKKKEPPKQAGKSTKNKPSKPTGIQNVGLIPVKIKKHGDKNGGHNHVILETFENKHVSVGLTTKPTKGKNSTHKNYKCEVSPLGDGKTSYMRRQGTVAPTKEYEPRGRLGKMTPKDYEKAKEYGEKAKRKHFEKNK